MTGASPGASAPAPAIAVLMATCNGAAYLRDQLNSLAAQSLPPRWLVVSDDASADDTRAILSDFAARNPAIVLHLRKGPGMGAAANFLSLLRQVPAEAELVAIADQDDVWLPGKLARGAEMLAAAGRGRPALLGTRSLVCDAQLQGRRPSPRWTRPFGFRHALVQSVAGGNTMMLNRAAVSLAAAAAAEAQQVVMHDWWLYQIVSGAGGRVLFDTEPQVLYRQHGANQIGANDGWRARIRRLLALVRGDFRHWNAVNLRALGASRHRLTPENRAVLAEFARLQQGGPTRRLKGLHQLGLYRQGAGGTASLWLAALIGRI